MQIDHLTNEVRWALLSVFLLLLIASGIVLVLIKKNPAKDYRELSQRMRTWWVIAVLFGFSLVLGEVQFLVFFAFVSFLAFKEYLSLIPTRRADHRALFWAYLSIPFQYYWIYLNWYGMFIIFIPVYMFMLIPARIILTGKTEGFLRSVGMIHWGLMTTVFSLSHAACLLVLDLSENARNVPENVSVETLKSPGPGLLILLIFLTQFNDVAQYVWGKSFGKRKLAPNVSPGKTVGGFLGGVFTTTLTALIVGPLLTILNWKYALVAGLIISVGGLFGDLSISALKRDLGVKDSGSILPGHGGILDRLDSLSFTAPLFFHFVYYLYF